jgi:hypothetical protein
LQKIATEQSAAPVFSATRMFRSHKTVLDCLLCGATALALLTPASVNAESPPVRADVKSLCSAWTLTQNGLAVVDQLIAVAKDGIQATARLLEECKAKPLCEYARERDMLEKSLADARNQQTKAEALSASMQERQNHIRDLLERLSGPVAIKACGGT